MVSAEEKDRMTGFVAERLEDSRLYNLLERNGSHVLLCQKPDIVEHPNTVYIAAHNDCRETIDDLVSKQNENASKDIYTAHIFYKDGKISMVRLGRRSHIKGNNRSLKQYPQEQKNAMVHLRGIEKAVLELGYPELIYYQPETERLPESLRIYLMTNVTLDYSHIRRGDHGYGFAQDTVSKDYKLPEERQMITIEPAHLILGTSPQKRAIIRRSE
ncbi:hypothetical protein J4448_01895 [Candidatus Woesearchaeota archaeon]|nr:hypothetical protein [Candidatus Woesearchaeota archaeon]